MNPERAGRRSVLLAISVATCGVLPAFLTGGLAVQIRGEIGFGESALGLAVSIFFISSALVSAGAGQAIERVGYRVVLRAVPLMAAASLLGVALFAYSWLLLVGFLIVGGLANAVAQPAVHLMLAREVSGGRQGLAFGIKQAAIPAATLLGGLAVPLIGVTVGWRWAFVLCAVGALGISCVTPQAQGRVATPGPGRSEGKTRPASLLVLAIGVGLGAAAAVPLGTFIVESGVQAGIRVGLAGVLLAVGSAVGIAVRVVSGWRADRRAGNHFLVVVLMLVLGAGGFALIASGLAPLLVVGTLLAFGAGWGWNGLFNFAVVTNNRDAPAAATGVTQTGVTTGSAVGPAAFGLLVEHASYGVAWLTAGGTALMAAAAIALGRRMLIRSRQKPS